MSRYINKKTGEAWEYTGSMTIDGIRYTSLIKQDDLGKKDVQSFKFAEDEMNEQFEFKPWPKPIVNIISAEVRHPMLIELTCPECGSKLKPEGGAYLIYPLKYEHICSNPDCKYNACVRSYYSGMCVAVTDEQEEKIKNGTYDEIKDGELIRIPEKELWAPKKY